MCFFGYAKALNGNLLKMTIYFYVIISKKVVILCRCSRSEGGSTQGLLTHKLDIKKTNRN